MLELNWLDGSSAMTDEDFKAWLDRFSTEAEARRQPHLVIDVRQFRHRPGPEVGGLARSRRVSDSRAAG